MARACLLPLSTVVLMLVISRPLAAQTLSVNQLKTAISQNNYLVCSNYASWNPNCCGQLSGGTTPATVASGRSPLCAIPLNSNSASFVDNSTFNHHHIAYDYRIAAPDDGGCAPCAADLNQTQPAASLGTLEIARRHRYRDMTHQLSSFGPGVFLNYDIRIEMYPYYFGHQLDLFDPQSLHPISLPGASGLFSDQTTDLVKEVRLFNSSGSQTGDLTQAVTADLKTYTGELFRFEVLQPANGGSIWDGRLTRIEDRNGYGVSLTYKQWTQQEIDQSPMRRYQIDTVTDAHGRTATFTYQATQVSGRWVISRIDLPGGQALEYLYSDKLIEVTHPDSETSTFTYTTDSTADCDVISYADPAAGGIHRNKDVYFKHVSGQSSIFTQAEMHARMVVGGTGEVTYYNQPDQNDSQNYTWIYQGSGELAFVDETLPGVRFYYDWTFDDFMVAFSGTPEPTYARGTTNPSETRVYDDSDRWKDHTYDAEQFVTRIDYPDGTYETFQYNQFKQPTRHRDRLARVTKYTYDTRGNRLTKEVGIKDVSGSDVNQPEHALYQWQYYAQGHQNQYLLSAAIDANGNQTDYQYDTSDRPSKIIEPPDSPGGSRAETIYNYDGIGRVSSILDPVGRTTQYVYDNCNRATKVQHHDGSTERTFYGTGIDAGLVVKTKDRNGIVTNYEYDAHGRCTRTVYAAAKMDLNDVESPVSDPSVTVEEICTYLPGTDLKLTCTRAGETTTYSYDYRQRVKTESLQPKVGTTLTTTHVYSNNQLFSTQDPYGRKQYRAYSASTGYPIRTIQGAVPSFSLADYSAVLNQLRDSNPNALFVVTDYIYNANGETTETVDPRNTSHTADYDSRGRETENVQAYGTAVAATTKTFYDDQGNVTEIQHPRHFDSSDPVYGACKTTIVYTGRNLLKSRTEATGTSIAATENYTYKLDGRLDVKTDARNNQWKTLWHLCCGRQAAAIDPLGHGTLSNNDYQGNVTHTAIVQDVTSHTDFHDPVNSKTFEEVTVKYDERHRPVARTVWLVARGSVDANAPPIAGEGGIPATEGLTTRWQYDDDLDNGAGLDAQFASHFSGLGLGSGSDGSAVLETSPEGHRTLTVRDGLGRAVRTVQLDSSGAQLTKNDIGHDAVVTISGYGDVLQISQSNYLGHSTKFRVDGIGRRIETADALNYLTKYTYDANGNQLSVHDPNNTGEDCVYDALNRDTACTDTFTDQTQKQYDKHGNVVKEIDAKLKETVHVYDARDRLTSTTDRLTGLTRWSYDLNSNLASLIDAESQVTSYAYDVVNRNSKETYPDHVLGTAPGDLDYGIIEFDYDPAGRLEVRTDQEGDTCTFNYDLAGRLSSRDYRALGSGTIVDTDSFSYDDDGHMLTAVSGRYSNTVTFTYDDAGRLATEALTAYGQTYTVVRGYDQANRLTQITYPDGSIVTRGYTDRDQLEQVDYDADGAGGGAPQAVTSFIYDDGGRESSRTFGNGLVTSRTYRTDNLVATIDTPGVTSFTYSYDDNKNKTAETIGGLMQPYGFTATYDQEDRLETWTRADSNKTQSWNLTLVGDWDDFTENSVLQDRSHDLTHELTAIDSTPLTYDAKGNLTQDHNGRTYNWDSDRQLVATNANGSSGVDVAHTYDALGRRASRSTSTSTTVFIHLTAEFSSRPIEQVISEYASASSPTAPQRQYVYGAYPDEPLLQLLPSPQFYHSGASYSVSALSANDQSVIERYAYTPYGALQVLAPDGVTPRNGSSLGNSHTYTGQLVDFSTGLIYYRTRYYHPLLGRFIGRDQLEYVDGSNVYQYTVSNPLSFVDPFGEGPFRDVCLSECQPKCQKQCAGSKQRTCLRSCQNQCRAQCRDWFPSDPVEDIEEMENFICATLIVIDVVTVPSGEGPALSGCVKAGGSVVRKRIVRRQTVVKCAKEHRKRGTTNPAKRKKHQKGKQRKKRDKRGGEKGDERRPYRRFAYEFPAEFPKPTDTPTQASGPQYDSSRWGLIAALP